LLLRRCLSEPASFLARRDVNERQTGETTMTTRWLWEVTGYNLAANERKPYDKRLKFSRVKVQASSQEAAIEAAKAELPTNCQADFSTRQVARVTAEEVAE
jgi:hypothetical protein